MSKHYRWSKNLAYVIGLIATDGCLSKDGRHIDFTSKDLELIKIFKSILSLKNRIGLKYSNSEHKIPYYRIQFGNVLFYKFLVSIGLTSNKSKTIGRTIIPDIYFRDFLRGCLDGDGSTYSYFDKRWKNSFMLYTYFSSGSTEFLDWLKIAIHKNYLILGTIHKGVRADSLVYAKTASLKLLQIIYYKRNLLCLSRKHSKIMSALSIISNVSGRGEMVYAYD